jgi:MoaA/NifB/PqqE/SkfB family radical SAM enzyme
MVIKSHTLSVEVTTRCNLNCGHCFAKAALEEFSDMSYDMAAQAAREGREAGFSTFHITGGEPLLWPGLFDLLGHAAELDYEKIIINTNGLLLEKKTVLKNSMTRYGVMEVMIRRLRASPVP